MATLHQRSVSKFLKLLHTISRELKSEDFSTIKFLCRDWVPRGDLESMTIPIELFTKLCDLEIITTDNTSFLEEILRLCDRLDLHQRVLKYCRSCCPASHLAARGRPQHVNSGGHISNKLPHGSQLQVTGAHLPHVSEVCGNNFPKSSTLTAQKLGKTSGPSFPGEAGTYSVDLSFSNAIRIPEHDGASYSESLSLSLPSVPPPLPHSCSNHVDCNLVSDGDPCCADEEIIYDRTQLMPTELDGQSNIAISHKPPCETSSDDNVHGTEELSDSILDNSDTDSDCAEQNQIPWRQYQLELSQPSLENKNCIICAPTGSGKTFTAGYILRELRNRSNYKKRSFKALFIVNNRHLITQQKNSLKEVFHKDSKCIQKIGDEFALSEWLIEYDIIVLTAQIVVNALEYDGMKISDFDVLVFDECHHADLKHPYQQIMNKYLKQKVEIVGSKLPQILGLTASLGTGSQQDATDHFVKLCSNLDCPTITYVKHNNEELLEHNPRPSIDQIIACNPRASDQFQRELRELMKRIEHRAGVLGAGSGAEYGTQQYQTWVVKQREMAEASEGLRHVHVACRALEHINTALMCYQEHCAKYVMLVLEEYFFIPKLSQTSLKIEEEIFGYFASMKATLSRLAGKERLEDNEKITKLVGLLHQLFSKDKESKGILLVHTRMSVWLFTKFLNENEELKNIIHVGKLVGQQEKGATTSGWSMSEHEQLVTLKRFRKGNEELESINLLVATDVAQEGLDMPKCNFVIRYNFVSNEIGTVQSKGRARAKNSECYLIVDCDSINHQRELQNLRKEHHMVEMLQNWDQQEMGELHRKIQYLQEIQMKKLQTEHERELAQHMYAAEDVGVHCKECKELLGKGSDIIMKGQHVLCVGNIFQEKTKIKRWPRKKEYRFEDILGSTQCRQCNSSIGTEVRYKKGNRMLAYTLGKDAVRFRLPGQDVYIKCRKWSEIPFEIRKEDLSK